MARPEPGAALGFFGISFLVFYLVVRLFFIPDITAALAAAHVRTIGDLLARMTPLFAVYLLWVYSFKVGMLLVVLGGALQAGMETRRFRLLTLGGVLYLATCYVHVVDYSPAFFGAQGTLILVLFVLIARSWMRQRPRLPGPARLASDLRMIGYFLLVVATWDLCGIFGIVTYALKPEIMIERGLQPTTLMLTSHVMMEMTLGWFLVFLGTRTPRAGPEQAP
jgi:hypothetical protein